MKERMKFVRTTLVSVIMVVLISAFCSNVKGEKPKLVIVITLDQFRADYLERYDAAYKDGFRYFKDNGWRYDKAVVDHAPTLSWPGHTTIATGAYPKTHGIIGNAFILDRVRRQHFLIDRDVKTLGGFPVSYSCSPKRIRVTGLADWIRAADPEARTVAISTSSSLAVCYGGHAQKDRSKNHVYMLEPVAGRFITTSYYRDSYPDWLSRFNEEILPKFKENLVWENSVPEEHRGLARVDTAAYEHDGIHTTFPHGIDDFYPEVNERSKNLFFHNYCPGANEALFALAEESIRQLELGQRNSTDFLAIAVNSTDRIGHDFGPHSLEQMDNVLRLDRLLGKLIGFLNQNVGPDDYIIALAADHGAPNIVEYDLEQGRPGMRVTQEMIRNVLLNIEELIDGYTGPEEELPGLIAKELEKADFIARAMTLDDLAGSGPADRILQSYRNSYLPEYKTVFPLWTDEVLYRQVSPKHPGNYGIVVEFAENAQLYTARSAHATSYWYDQTVPIIFMGGSIRSGISQEKARTIDIAPTLAALAGLTYPDTVDGKVLTIPRKEMIP